MKSRHLHRRNSGQGLVEFALIAPILLFTIMGIVDFGRAMIVYSQGSNALRNAARYAEVWGGEAAGNHQYLECGAGEAIQQLTRNVMFANVSTKIIFVKKGFYDADNDFLDDGAHTITCDEAKANPDALETGDMMILESTGSFNTITPLISNILPTASFQFRAQRTIITNMRIGETTSTTGNGIVNCSVGSNQPEVTVRTSRPSSVVEGGSAIITFSLCEPSATNITVSYTVSGTASPSDYSGIASSSVTFTPGQQSHAIPVSILTDAVQENTSETIVVTLTAITSGTAVIGKPSVATILILNDSPSGLCSQLQIHVGYLSWGALRFKIQNVGSQNYDYSSLRLFYYFTRQTSGQVGTDASKQTDDNVNLASTTHMIEGNNGYLEIRVTDSGTLQGSSSSYVSGTLQLFEGTTYNFNNISNLNDDWSSEGVPSNGLAALVHKVPLTVNGTIVCGEHPTGPGGGSTTYPTASISPASMSVNEGSTANLTISLSAPSPTDVTIALTITGNVVSSDYGPPAVPSTITIPAGTTSVPLNILIADDTDQEDAETLTVNLAQVTTQNATIHFSNYFANVLIPKNDTHPSVSLHPSALRVDEGGTAALEFRLSGAATSHVFVEYEFLASGTASSADYSPTTTPASITIPMGSTTAPLNLTITDDSIPEGAETIVVAIKRVTSQNATVNDAQKTATVTIPANDALPVVTLSASASNVTEGGSIAFTATLAGSLNGSTVTVDYGTVNGTAVAGTHYTAASGTFTFTPSDSGPKSVVVATTGDSVPGGNKTFDFRLTNPANATLATPATITATIVDDDLPTISISYESNNQSLTEGSTRDIILTLSAASASAVTVQCQVDQANSTATYLTDFDFRPATAEFVPCTGTITFPTNTTVRKIRVRTNQTVSNDTIDEFDETVVLKFSNPVGATLAANEAQVTIVDNDGPPTVTINSPTALETASSIMFNVELNKASGKPIRIYFTVLSGTAHEGNDYTMPSPLWVDFSPGQTLKPFVVPLISGNVAASSETFSVTITNQDGNATIGTAATGTATLQDAPASTLSVHIKFREVGAVNMKETPIHLSITNNGTTSVPLSQLKLRYYFNREGTVGLVYVTDYAQNTSDWAGITGSVHGAFTYGNGVNSFVEISFTSGAGSLSPGASANLEIRIHTEDWSEIINETNDYSYHSSAPSNWTPWNRVTLYRNNSLISGTAP